MANCVDTLEAILGSADCKLDSILYQLERKTAGNMTAGDNGCAAGGSGADDQPLVMSCSAMIADLKQIQSDVQLVRDEYREVLELQRLTEEELMKKCEDVQQKVLQVKRNVKSE